METQPQASECTVIGKMLSCDHSRVAYGGDSDHYTEKEPCAFSTASIFVVHHKGFGFGYGFCISKTHQSQNNKQKP